MFHVDTTEQPGRAALTENQRRVLNSLAAFWQERGYGPSLDDLRVRMGFEAKNGVRCHLEALRRKGWVTWEPGKPRTLHIIPAERAA